jgi:hypothetical protein
MVSACATVPCGLGGILYWQGNIHLQIFRDGNFEIDAYIP